NVNALAAGTYNVTITDANGCTLMLSFTLTQPTDLVMPTGFSPNGDGSNDAYVVHGLDGFPNNRMLVVNRWGNTVFDQLNYRNDWRGENQQGEALPNGTYFVVITINEGEQTMQNYVDLRR
ncbi:MAG: gliding motility-associated C-terminal domain-containing protein, partial [Flavobacteriales bacterium]|nr:gliding motility-associated C-terminal domain-containing protein [Flavobacteriales bacterium]